MRGEAADLPSGSRGSRHQEGGLTPAGGVADRETGVLGEGIRQALLRDPTYISAVRCARTMAA